MLTWFGESENHIVIPRKSRATNKFSAVSDLMHAQKCVVGTWEILCMIAVIPTAVGLRKANSKLNIKIHRKSDKTIIVR